MRKIIVILFLIKALFAFPQTQHMNQLIKDVFPNFIADYNNTHQMELVIIKNQMPYRVAHSLGMKNRTFVDGKINGGLKDGYYCSSPSFYLVSKDTLSIQFFLCGANKKFPGLGIGDSHVFYFVYEQAGKWKYNSGVSSHATWYKKGKFVGDFVKECMEHSFGELERNNSLSHHKTFVIDDYLTLFVMNDSILPDLPHIPKGYKIKHYCKGDDWLIGFPEISFYNDTIAVSSKAFRAKDYKNDLRINNYMQCTLYYLYNAETQLWNVCKTVTESSITGTGLLD